MCALAYIKKKLYLCSRFNCVRIVNEEIIGDMDDYLSRDMRLGRDRVYLYLVRGYEPNERRHYDGYREGQRSK